MCKSEKNLGKSILCFHHIGPGVKPGSGLGHRHRHVLPTEIFG